MSDIQVVTCGVCGSQIPLPKRKYNPDLPYWKSITSKGFVLYSTDEEKLIAAWENPNASYSCFERFSDGNAIFCHYENIDTFVKSITWHSWIKEGIIDDKLLKLVEDK